jgi:hypothetical protein
MGIPSNHKRIGIAWLLSFDRSPRPWNETPLVPGPVTKLTTFDRGKTGGECAEQQGGGHPERELRCAAAGTIGRGFCLGDDLVYPLFRIGLAHAGLCRDQARHIGPVGGSEFGVLADGGGPQPGHFRPRHIGVGGRSRRRGGVRAEKPVDVHLRGVHALRGLSCHRTNAGRCATYDMRGRSCENAGAEQR